VWIVLVWVCVVCLGRGGGGGLLFVWGRCVVGWMLEPGHRALLPLLGSGAPRRPPVGVCCGFRSESSMTGVPRSPGTSG